MKYACPCCGYFTLETSGEFSVCEICFWEDDPIQSKNHDYESGTNPFSLKKSQENFINFGACDKDMLKNVRPVKPNDKKDPNWIKY